MSEKQIEQDLIKKLVDFKYIYRPDIRDRAKLEQNFRKKFEDFNNVTLTDDENKYFVFNLLKTSNIQKYFEKELTGSTIKNLSLASLKNTKAFFPTPAEQQIVALKLHKKGLMQQLFPSVEEVKG